MSTSSVAPGSRSSAARSPSASAASIFVSRMGGETSHVSSSEHIRASARAA